MKRVFLLIVAACLSLVACDRQEYIGASPGDHYNLFSFIIYDKEGNNVAMQDDFQKEDLTLEYEGMIFTPCEDFQKVDYIEFDHIRGDYHNAILFDDMVWIDENGIEYVTWKIFGHRRYGNPARYILRYKDNEWIVDYIRHSALGNPIRESVQVNGENCEEVFVFRAPCHPDNKSQDQRNCDFYPLYTK